MGEHLVCNQGVVGSNPIRSIVASRNPDPIAITNNAAAGQFEARAGDRVAVLRYRRSPDRIVFVHTEVPEGLRGHGVADQLAHAGLEFARAEKLNVIPLCPFVATYIRRHPEFEPLVDAHWRQSHHP